MSQDGAENASAGAETPDVSEARERMAVIKKEVAAEVDEKWTTPYRTPEMFDLKVNARLASHEEYRSLQDQVREADAVRTAKPDTATGD